VLKLWDNQPNPRLIAIDQRAALDSIDIISREMIGGAGVEQLLAAGPRSWSNTARHVAYIVGCRVAQQDQLHHGDDHQGQRAGSRRIWMNSLRIKRTGNN
jgi:hypothetical protein